MSDSEVQHIYSESDIVLETSTFLSLPLESLKEELQQHTIVINNIDSNL